MEKIAVQCKDEREWVDVISKMRSGGSEFRFESIPDNFSVTGYNCLEIDIKNRIDYSHRQWYKDSCYTIITAQEYLNEGGKDVKEFSIGDRVECINSKSYSHIKVGETYTIESFNSFDSLKFEELGSCYSYTQNCFKLAGSATKPKTTKENNMELNSSIRTVFVDEDNADYGIVEKMQNVFGGEIAEDFTGAMILRNNKDEYLAEIKRLDDIEAKRLEEEAKK